MGPLQFPLFADRPQSKASLSLIRDILKHELAHYLTFLIHGSVQAHGAEFRETCRRFGFPEEVSQATMNLDESNLAKEGDLRSEKVLERVKKLLELARSSNTHEAELATLKANELLLRHNLDSVQTQDEPVYMDRILLQKRKDSKLTAIYEILRHFIVRPVISMGKNSCALEVSGSLTNVKLASYVANFLNRELDHLWEVAKKEHGLSGLREKNSFYLGVAQGFDLKMKQNKAQYSEADKRALVVVEKKLDIDVQQVYRRLSQTRSGHESDPRARSHGETAGLSLTIRNAVEGKNPLRFLTKG
jgi:hypothetical protein